MFVLPNDACADRLLAITDKPLKIVTAWKKDGPGVFWLKTLDGKPAAPVPDGASVPQKPAALATPEIPKSVYYKH